MVGHRYTEEEHKFLHSFIPGHTYKEIVAEYNKRFEEPITETRVKGYMANHKINNGLTGRFKKGHIPANKGTHPPTVGRMAETQFKKGGLPPNTKPVGYERITKDGYIEVKIKMRPSHPSCNDNFKAKHHIVWEEANGPIPKGYKLTFLDGNKQNCVLENLALITNAEHLQMTRRGLRSEIPQITERNTYCESRRCFAKGKKEKITGNGYSCKRKEQIMAKKNVEEKSGNLVFISIDELYPHPDNPRKDLGDLTELADSIKAKGVLQNLTVVRGHAQTQEEWSKYNKLYNENPSEELREKINAKWYEDGYTVIIGHRRTEASKMAGLTVLPCIIADMTPEEQVTTMMLENMQRSDLTVYEQAKGFQLMLDFGNTVETVAEKSGFSPTTVRRRIKLLELDEEKFKKSESRGVTLFEYMELDKIKDIDLKNKVLDTIGTANFNNELKKAIEQEETKEYFDTTEEEIAKFATKIEDSSGYAYVTDFSTWRKNKVVVPDDVDTVKYYYKRDKNYISLYKEKVVTEAEEEKKRIEAEKAADRDRRKEELKAASERAYELRAEAIDSISNSHALKHLPGIMAFLMKATCDSHYIRIDNADIAEMVGFDTDSEEYEDWTDEEFNEHLFGLIETKTKDKAAQCLLKYAYALCEDSGNKSYYDWYAMHSTNKKLDRIYDFLCSLGYEMSDEEKALRDGTHELYITEESE